jgi:ribose transport system substrate-binding protein
MINKRFLLSLFIFLIILTSLLTAEQNNSKKKIKLYMVTKGVNLYYDSCFEGFRDSADKNDVIAEIINPSRFDLELQIQIIKDLIQEKADGIAISALHDTGLIPVIDEAVSAGIKVITFDAQAPSTKAASYVGTDNYKAGYEAGRIIASLIKNKTGDVAILQGGTETLNLNLRTEGFRQALLDIAPNIKVVVVIDTHSDYALAVNKTEFLLDNYPKLKAVFGVSAYEAPAAALVIKERNRKDVIVGGFDDLKDTIKGIHEGYIQFTIVQSTYKMGWISAELLLDLIKGKKIPKIIDTGIIVVDKRNIENYFEEMKKEFKN